MDTLGINLRTVALPEQRPRTWARTLFSLHPRQCFPGALSNDITGAATAGSSEEDRFVTVLCISDTHNKQPALPPADVLIHAGDLTEYGTFDELQTQLRWLSSQPHPYKIAVAGNHDVLLDEEFLRRYPGRRNSETEETRDDLDWGDVIYLEDSSVTLEFPPPSTKESSNANDQTGTRTRTRTLAIYGSPWSPRFGKWPFQYPREEADSFWAGRIPPETDIVVVHGPPLLHLDMSRIGHAGCPSIAREIGRVRPRLAVFGHIHEAYGKEEVVLDGAKRCYEEIVTWRGTMGMMTLCGAVLAWLWYRVVYALLGNLQRPKLTTFVNAAVVGGGLMGGIRNAPVVVKI